MSGKGFRGLVFCPTSVPASVSDSICQKVTKLGGTFTKDLTRLVNVLVVGELFTAKYNFAIKNRTDIVFVRAECIDELYEMWLSGQDLLQLAKFDMLKYMAEHYTVPPFDRFNIFIGRVGACGGYTLEKLVELCKLGKVKRLDTDHFIRNSSSSKSAAGLMTIFVTDDLSGHRVQAAMEEDVPVVHPKWIVDCMDRMGTLDFNGYYLLKNCQSLDYEEIGAGSYIKVHKKPQKQDLLQQDQQNLLPGDLVAPLKIAIDKFKPQATQIWGKLLAREDPSASRQGSVNPPAAAAAPTVAAESVNQDSESMPVREKMLASTPGGSNIFANCHFVLYRFEPRQVTILSSVIHGNKGTCSLFSTDSSPAKPGVFYICSSQYAATLLPDLPAGAQWLTEFFIERCLYYEQLLAPDLWSQPFYNKFEFTPPQSLLHGSNLSFHITGFHGVELLHINKIIEVLKSIGFEHHEKLTKKTDFLLVNISQLTSIPKEHTLRQNKYASMFRTDLDMKISLNQAQMFKNSMKRKFEFVKTRHQIPILTPSFIIEMFHRSMKQNKPSVNIYFNDVNWCISCPKGSKTDFMLQIIPKPVQQQQKQQQEKLESVSEMGTPAITRPSSAASSSTASEHINVPHRESRWGKLLSNTLEKENEEPSFIQEDQESDPNNHDHITHTQITYGTAPKNVKRRKISTRSQVNDVISRV